LLDLAAALYLYLNTNPISLEKDLQTTILGLSPVTWFLLIEIVALGALVWLSSFPVGQVRRPASTVVAHRAPAVIPHSALLLMPALVWLVLALWSSPQLQPFWLPYVGYLDAVTLASGAWLPASLLAGYAIVNVVTWIWNVAGAREVVPRWSARQLSLGLAGLAVVAAILVGLASGLSLVPINDRKLYVAQADVDALVWMRDNLPRDSFVFANSFAFPWSPGQVLGLDSGLWIPLVSGLRSSVPPIAAYNERAADPQYFDRVRALGLTAPLSDSWQKLKAAGVTHIYIGSRAGDAGFPAASLLQDNHVKLLFHEDNVWVFEIV
jgi:hypothetical protein